MAIDTMRLKNEIKLNGKVRCPLCNKGFLESNPNIPFEKQRKFVCSYCEEKLLINVRMPR